MKIKRFNEKLESKKYTLEDYKKLCTEMRDVLEIGSAEPDDILRAVKDLQDKWKGINKNNLYFYHQD